MNKFYLTTTLPYVNDVPHIGHTLEFIQADVIVRYMRKKLGADNVFFNVGADEHGLKIFNKAKEVDVTPQEYVDKYAAKWEEFCKLFDISYDSFYRTSAEYHIKPAQEFWRVSEKAGDIYKKSYTGMYCVGCEEFKTEKDIVDGKCPLHDKVPVEISEENYFFRLSKYREALLDWFTNNPEVLKPQDKLEELKNWISQVEDISISRVKEKLPWGIEVPGDPTQVMYVWFDALTNYANVVGFGTDEKKFETWWPAVQCFGPDNLRFQCAIWQAMLASAGLPFSKKLLRHGMVLAEDGTKMSKTKGNGISPFDQLEKFSSEAIRFYLIAGLPTYSDASYKEKDLINLYNSHLANNFGNLLNRVLHLVKKYEIGYEVDTVDKAIEVDMKQYTTDIYSKACGYFDEQELQLASEEIIKLCNFGNEYITKEQPWSQTDSDRRKVILLNLVYLLKIVIELYEPILPVSSKKAMDMLKNKETGILFEKIEV